MLFMIVLFLLLSLRKLRQADTSVKHGVLARATQVPKHNLPVLFGQRLTSQCWV